MYDMHLYDGFFSFISCCSLSVTFFLYIMLACLSNQPHSPMFSFCLVRLLMSHTVCQEKSKKGDVCYSGVEFRLIQSSCFKTA